MHVMPARQPFQSIPQQIVICIKCGRKPQFVKKINKKTPVNCKGWEYLSQTIYNTQATPILQSKTQIDWKTEYSILTKFLMN